VGRGPVTAERWLTPVDVRLLAELGRDPNLVRAAKRIGVARDRAVYRLLRLRRLYGSSVVTTRRGGRAGGGTRLTRLGRRLLERATGAHSHANRWAGIYRTRPSPHVTLEGGGEIAVSFRLRDGAATTVEVDPEALVVARRPAELSARNRLTATVAGVDRHADGTAYLTARWHRRPVRVALTTGSVDRLGLRPGRAIYLYAKATAVRRVPRA